MRTNHSFCVVAPLGMILSFLDLGLASSGHQAKPQLASHTVITDIALSQKGELRGQIVDRQGVAVRGAVVSIYQAKRRLKSTLSLEYGVFTFKGLSGGLYVLSVGNSRQGVRLWRSGTAPPSSRKKIMLVVGKSISRGQYKLFRMIRTTRTAIILGGTAIGFGIYESTLENKPPAS